jgi:uncharacterized protein
MNVAIAAAVDRPAWIPAPRVALRAVLGEMSQLLLADQRAIPRRLDELGLGFAYARLEPALGDLFG